MARMRRTRGGTGRRIAVGLTLLVAVVAPAGGSEARPDDRYVALGDSYTAGPLIPSQVSPLGCLKSNRNYPNLVNASLGGAAFTDISCSGAETEDMSAPQAVEGPDNPAQLSALSLSTTLVTIGIGGNDIGFSEIIQNCATYNPFSTPCKDRYVRNGVDEISARIAATAPDVGAVLAEIEARSPSARVFVVGYPQVLPERGIGCWPSLPIAWGDVPYLRGEDQGTQHHAPRPGNRGGRGIRRHVHPQRGSQRLRLLGDRWVEPLVPSNPAPRQCTPMLAAWLASLGSLAPRSA